ncbi:uncharacterized protein [Macrobrachium rosenbergii]|uniref:uncharacterized protein n=1 Tax=Macrobrachium rosenbergii TaxID=79674 RepID=UPI0034D4D281
MALSGIISFVISSAVQAAFAQAAAAQETAAAQEAAAAAREAAAQAAAAAQEAAAQKAAAQEEAAEVAQKAAPEKTEKTKITMASKQLQCRVCNNVFSDECCPRILPCSHTLCDLCIARIISTGEMNACPVCRKAFTASSVEDLGVVEELSFNHMGYRNCYTRPMSPPKEFTNDSRTKYTKKGAGYRNCDTGPMCPFQEFTDNFREKCTKKGIADCQEAEAQVADAIAVSKMMKNKFLENNKKIAGLIKTLEKWQLSNENKASNIDQNTKLFGNMLATTRQEKGKLQDFDARLAAATDFIFVGAVMEDAGKDYELAMKKIGENNDLFQRTESGRNDTVEKLVMMTATLRNIAEEIEGSEDASLVNITASDLQSLCRLVKDDVPREIFAVKVFDGRQGVAQVKRTSKNQVYLSHLQEKKIPPNSFVIKFESLMEKFSRRTFLVLGVDGKHLGKVIITVLDKGNLARNFHHMCAGDVGPSYANSPVLGVHSKGEAGESIYAGEYTVKGRTSRDAVAPSVDWRAETQRVIYEEAPLKAGDVVGCTMGGSVLLNPYFISHFNIVIKDGSSSSSRYRFGVVEEGLDVLREAILRGPDIQKVKIVDCGHIISF